MCKITATRLAVLLHACCSVTARAVQYYCKAGRRKRSLMSLTRDPQSIARLAAVRSNSLEPRIGHYTRLLSNSRN